MRITGKPVQAGLFFTPPQQLGFGMEVESIIIDYGQTMEVYTGELARLYEQSATQIREDFKSIIDTYKENQ